jgi:signal transduction histidine kinase
MYPIKFLLLYYILQVILLPHHLAATPTIPAEPNWAHSERIYKTACPYCNRQSTNTAIQLYHQSHTLLSKHDYTTALPLILSAIRETELSHKDTLLYFSYLMQASIYNRNQLLSEERSALESAKKIGERLQLPLLYHLYNDLGNIFFAREEYTKAISYYLDFEKRFPTFNDSAVLKLIYNNMAISYLHLEQYKLSEKYHLKSLAIEKIQKDTAGIASSYLNLGSLYFEQYQDKKARTYWLACLRMTQHDSLPLIAQNVYYNLSLVEQSLGHYQQALTYHRQYTAIKEKNWNRDKVWELLQQEKKYEVSLKQKEVAALQQKNLLQAAIMRTHTLERNSLLIIAIGLVIISAIIFYSYKQKQRSNRIKDRLFSIVAHDLRSPVYQLQLLHTDIDAHLAHNQYTQLPAPLSDMKQVLHNFQHLLDNLLQWVWIHTDNLHFDRQQLHILSIVNMVVYDFAAQLRRKQLTCTYNIAPDLFVQGDQGAVCIILRNIISNAIKHTENGSITIAVVAEKHTHTIQVKDTGRGIPRQHQHLLFNYSKQTLRTGTAGEPATGMGLWLCKYLVEKNKGTIRIISEEHKGTSVFIRLPVQKTDHARNENFNSRRQPAGSKEHPQYA